MIIKYSLRIVLTLATLAVLVFTPLQADERLLVSSRGNNDIISYDGQNGDFLETYISGPSLVGGLRGITIGPDGDIYACYRNGARVLRFDGDTGRFKETFVPDNSGGLTSPVDLAFGPGGNLYVVSSNQGIFRYDGDTGDYIDLFIPVDFGTNYYLDGPSALVIDLANNNLLVSDMNNGSVLRFNATNGVYVGYFVSPYSNGLDAPRAMAFGPDNNLYVSCLSNGGAILRFHGVSGSFIDTFVDYMDGGMDMPEGIAFGPSGDLYVSDIFNDRILQFDGSSGSPLGPFIPSGSNGLDDPYGLIFDADGNLHVDAYNTGLMTFDGQTGDLLNLVPLGWQLDDARGMAVGPDEQLYFSDDAHDEVQRYDSESGCFIDHFVELGNSPLQNPRDLVFGPDDNLYVVSSIDGVYRFDGTTGAYIDLFVPVDYGSEYELGGPSALLFGPDGHLYVADMNNGSVVRFNGSTGAYMGYFVSPYSGNLDAPREMVFGPDGHLYISSLYDDGTILRFNGANGNFIDTFVSAGSGGLDQPEGLVFGPDDHLYVADYWNDRVLKYDGANGSPLGIFVTADSDLMSNPYNLLFVEDSSVGVAEDNPDPARNLMQANFPNPFNPATTIRFSLSVPGEVSLRIHDLAGRVVRELVDGLRVAGDYSATWDGLDDRGNRQPSGVYLAQLVIGEHRESRKLTLMK